LSQQVVSLKNAVHELEGKLARSESEGREERARAERAEEQAKVTINY
jgi:hypothetical protein